MVHTSTEYEKNESEEGKSNALIPLNLARGLVSLLVDRACECCTPGHRAGRGYQFLRDLKAPALSPKV